MSEFPASGLRGLRKADWVSDTVIQTQAFVPDANTSATRSDKGQETSINWEDDATVEAFTLANPNAQHGAARILTADVHETSVRARMVTDPLLCERNPIDGNPFHGNIVFRFGLKPHTVKMLAAALALKSEFVPPRNSRR